MCIRDRSANAPPSTLGSSSIAASSVRILRSAPCFAAENTQHAYKGPGLRVEFAHHGPGQRYGTTAISSLRLTVAGPTTPQGPTPMARVSRRGRPLLRDHHQRAYCDGPHLHLCLLYTSPSPRDRTR